MTALATTARMARPSDARQVEALMARCSPDTLYRRFHGMVGSALLKEVERIAHPSDHHRSWVAVADGEVRGTATLAWGSDGTVEAAFLVEDAWRRRGVGSQLFAELMDEAARSGIPSVLAIVQVDNEPARRFLRSQVPAATFTFAGYGELEIAVPVAPISLKPVPAGVTLRRTA